MSNVTIESILLHQATLGPSSPSPVASGVVNLLPYHDFSVLDELTFIITVLGVTGTPTGGSLSAKFQLGTPHGALSASGYPWTGPLLFDLDTAQKSTLITEGEDWPAPIAAYNASFPVTVKRTIRGWGALCNLQLDASTLTGGTNPKFTISAVLIQKAS